MDSENKLSQKSSALSRGAWQRGSLSWLCSLFVHCVLILGLWLCVLSIAKDQVWEVEGQFASQQTSTAEFSLSAKPADVQPSEASDSEIDRASVQSSVLAGEVRLSRGVQPPIATSFATYHASQSLVSEVVRVGDLTDASLFALRESFSGRNPSERDRLLHHYGGSEESERAVALALEWLSRHQAKDGGWTFAHHEVCNGQCDSPGNYATARNAATALALLPFLGAGYTHREGPYREVVQNGLQYLLTHSKRSDLRGPIDNRVPISWFEPQGTMYSHCLTTIVLCEAYAMTKDSALRDPAQGAVDFLVVSQNSVDGGWRYAPRDPGDSSVVGWAVMALTSAKIGGLIVPDATVSNAHKFFDRVRSKGDSVYGYMAPDKNPHGLAATTSIGMLCRIYDGWGQSHQGLQRGIRNLGELGPSTENLYYSYYATQVLHHWGGSDWKEWNRRMRDPLIARQVKTNHAAGSWPPNRELDGMAGGRLYVTAVSAMILEVYYRHMPIYTELAIDDDFEL